VPEEADVLKRLVAWAEVQPTVRAMILTSSRARDDETVDELSDYDVIVAVTAPDEFLGNEAYVSAYERPLARWGDEDELLGLRTTFRGVVYEDGVKIDFTIWPAELLERVAEQDGLPECLDVGYRVLVDKDARTGDWKPPTFQAHIPRPPTEEEYRALVEEFWWSSTYVAKALRRGEVVFVKFVLDYDMKLGVLRRFLEWRLEIEHGWNVRPGVLGRGLERLLPPDLVDALHATYVGGEVNANWDALFATAALFRRVAREVGNALGYEYPQEVDDGIEAQLKAVRDGRRAPTRGSM
jgi:aminoglycoside 6-adenylyltransferase